MTTTIEDNALNTELQELYLITKQWLADLQFISDESNILKNISQKSLEPEVNMKLDILFSSLGQQVSELKLKVIHLLKELEPLTYGPIKEIKISLIEDQQLLMHQMEEILLNFQTTKNELLNHQS